MKDFIIGLVSGVHPVLATVLLSALPVTEMRAALPIALTVYDLSPFVAITAALIGNILPIPILLWILPRVITFIDRNIPPLQPLMKRYFDFLRSKHSDKFEKIGASSLGLVAILPLPGAGVWTGCLLAVLFRIRPQYSLPALIGGAFVEAIVIFLIVQGTLSAFSFLLAV